MTTTPTFQDLAAADQLLHDMPDGPERESLAALVDVAKLTLLGDPHWRRQQRDQLLREIAGRAWPGVQAWTCAEELSAMWLRAIAGAGPAPGLETALRPAFDRLLELSAPVSTVTIYHAIKDAA